MKQHAPATLRNREPLLAVLRHELPPTGTLLEVASGSGEHAVYFAAAFPALQWQPSDLSPVARASVEAYRAESALPNLRPPVALDATTPAERWPVARADAILCANLIHIAPFAACEGLIAGAAALLPAGAPLVLYGPFREGGVFHAPSNAEFDASLRARDAAWGVRDLDDVTALAEAAGLRRAVVHPMPANNLTVVFRR